MKASLYHESARGAGYTGGMQEIAVVAEALRQRGHGVEIVHHAGALDVEALAERTSTRLAGVTSRAVATAEPTESRDPRQRYRAEQAWGRAISGSCDAFVAFTYDRVPLCHASRGVLRALFPVSVRPRLWRPPPSWPGRPLSPRWWPRGAYQEWIWNRRLAGYQARAANSSFTRDWLRRRWDIDSEVVYSPVGQLAPAAVKRDLIISVGRFSRIHNAKKQLELVQAFRRMQETGPLPGWEFVCAGGVGGRADDRAYFEEVRAAAEGLPVRVLANVEPPELARLYGEASILWHAAGLGEDERAHPERFEHFGIVIGEAMSAGCVPVVIDKGGPAEIVEPGTSGFLWPDTDAMAAYTRQLAGDAALRARMAAAGRTRAVRYDRGVFAAAMVATIEGRDTP